MSSLFFFGVAPSVLGVVGAFILIFGLIEKSTKAVSIGLTCQAAGVAVLVAGVWQVVTWTP